MKKILLILAVFVMTFALTACFPEADVASENISKDADNFKVFRRISFYNVIHNLDTHVIEGFCNIVDDQSDQHLEVTCKIGDEEYYKDYLKYSEFHTYQVIQMEASNVSGYHFKIYVRPETLLPDFELDIEKSDDE